MNLDNESVNHLIRRNKAMPSFATAPDLSYWLDENGNVRPTREHMPLVDALTLMIGAGMDLHPDAVHPPSLAGLQISTNAFSQVFVTLVRGAPLQPEIDEAPNALNKAIDKEIKDAIGAHKVAELVLKELVSVEKIREKRGDKFNVKDDYTMDKFLDAIRTSPYPEFTKALLSESGPGQLQWVAPNGPLPILDTVMTPALMATKTVEVEAKVLYVRDKQCVAFVEIVGFRNEYAKSVLCHHNSEVELKFDIEGTERDDLVLMQYLSETVPLKVSAVCAVHAKFSKKTVLTLKKLGVSRERMNQLHATVHGLQLPMFPDTSDEP